MAIEFGNTVRGAKFYDADVPRLIRAVEQLSARLNNPPEPEPEEKTQGLKVTRFGSALIVSGGTVAHRAEIVRKINSVLEIESAPLRSHILEPEVYPLLAAYLEGSQFFCDLADGLYAPTFASVADFEAQWKKLSAKHIDADSSFPRVALDKHNFTRSVEDKIEWAHMEFFLRTSNYPQRRFSVPEPAFITRDVLDVRAQPVQMEKVCATFWNLPSVSTLGSKTKQDVLREVLQPLCCVVHNLG